MFISSIPYFLTFKVGFITISVGRINISILGKMHLVVCVLLEVFRILSFLKALHPNPHEDLLNPLVLMKFVYLMQELDVLGAKFYTTT